MDMEVEFVTLGDASERLKVPPPTLRNWTDQLEEFNTHFVKRNSRNERMYYENDLVIFDFIRDVKKEHGRKATMKDIAPLLKEDAERFELRSQEDAPSPVTEPSNKTGELITPDDVQRLMENQRVRALLGYMIGETTKQLRGEILEELQNQREQDREELKDVLREEVRKEIQEANMQMTADLAEFQSNQKQRDEEQKEAINKREIESTELIKGLTLQQNKENEEIKEANKQLTVNLTEFEIKQKQRDDEHRDAMNKRDIESMKLLRELASQRNKENEEKTGNEQKGFFAKLFGTKTL